MIVFIILFMITNELTFAVIVSSESDPLDPIFNDTGSVWNCFEARYQRESVEEMSESLLTCAKRNLYLGLLHNVDSECVDIGDGVTFVSKQDNAMSPREIFPLAFIVEEPATFRGVIDAYSSFLSRRAVRWDLGFLYPGLVMKIGPTMNGAGILEFALERRLNYNDRSKLRPGQLIVRRTILPHLLGFRMNLMNLLPVILGILLFVSKNAFVFSKLSLIFSSLLTLKSLFLMQQIKPTEMYDIIESGSVSQSEIIGMAGGSVRPKPQTLLLNSLPENLLEMFSATAPPFRGVNDKNTFSRNKGKRNFVWEKQE